MDDAVLMEMINSETCLVEESEGDVLRKLLRPAEIVEETALLSVLQDKIDVLLIFEVVVQLADIRVVHTFLNLYLPF